MQIGDPREWLAEMLWQGVGDSDDHDQFVAHVHAVLAEANRDGLLVSAVEWFARDAT